MFKSRNDTAEQRRKRLEIADPKPKKVYCKVALFLRNVDVVAEVLERASDQCALCKKEAPVVRVKGDTPYLDAYSQNESAVKAYERAGFTPSLIEMKLKLE
ncbi:hypothetical protein [Shewanella surugensis]|uniref:ATPase n=1 Tax=Shewanella surugensis TaxID=212020 RepID=A0ABT0L826_9GAMM|nr:hypothetical protein [Shewanella surugensis]MCL1123645.1 hypothetical protein [Shewanella surugensis]